MMRTVRNPQVRLSDLPITLVLLHLCSEIGIVGDRLKAMVLMFEATFDLFQKQYKGLNLSFFRYSYGPFTPVVYEVWEELCWIGWLEIEPGNSGQVRVTKAGQDAAVKFAGKLKDDWDGTFVLDAFRGVADVYCPLRTSELLDRMYKQETVPVGSQKPVRIWNAKQGVQFTRIVDDRDAVRKLSIPSNDISELLRTITATKGRDFLPLKWHMLYENTYESALVRIRGHKGGKKGTRIAVSDLKGC